MQFTPKTEKEIEELGLWPDGQYGFEILEFATLGQNTLNTEDRQSSKGNEMIQLVLHVFDDEGQSKYVIDYLLEKIPAKLRNSAYACALGEKYETGTLTASDYIGKTGFLKLKTQKDKKGEYPDRNAVADYVPETQNVPSNDEGLSQPGIDKIVGSPAVEDDEIPF